MNRPYRAWVRHMRGSCRAAAREVLMNLFPIFLRSLLGILAVLLGGFLTTMFLSPEWLFDLLGITKGEPSRKYQTLKFLGIGMGGVLVALQALMSYRRAEAMEKAANAQADGVRETEQGRRQERLKNAIEHLGNEKGLVRLGGAYELFHLARDTQELRQTVLDILCAYIRQTTSGDEYREKYEAEPSEEVQSMLTLLFVQEHEVFKNCPINLQGSWLNGIELVGARLAKADLSQAHLQGAELMKARLQRAKLVGAQLQEAELAHARLQRAKLMGARLQRAKLAHARLQRAELAHAWLQRAELQSARLQRAKLVGAQLQEAKLRDAQLQGAKLAHAWLQRTELAGAQLQKAKLRDAQLQGAKLMGAQLQKAKLRDAQLQGAELMDAQLQEAKLRDAQLQEAKLRDAQLQEAELQSVQLQGANLMGARLQGTKLARAQLQGAKLAHAQLQGADLWRAWLQGADLWSAQLQGANLARAQLQGADLLIAQLQGVGSHLTLDASFEERIRDGIGKPSDLSKVVFAGGLSQEAIDSLVQGLSDEHAQQLREKLTPHLDKPISHQPPDEAVNRAVIGTYTAEAAEQWIAEYQQAMWEVPKAEAD